MKRQLFVSVTAICTKEIYLLNVCMEKVVLFGVTELFIWYVEHCIIWNKFVLYVVSYGDILQQYNRIS